MRRSQGVRTLFLLRRIGSARMLLAGVLLVALVTTAVLAALADFAAGPMAAAAQHEVAASPAAFVQVSSTASAAQAGPAASLITTSLRSALRPAGLRIQSALWSDPLDLRAPGGNSATWIAEVAVLADFAGQTRLSQGSWPGPPGPGQPYPVTAPAADARLLGLQPGQVLSLIDGDTGGRVRLLITGLYTVRDPSARYWGLDLLPVTGVSVQQGFRSYGPFIAAPGAFAAGRLPVGERSWLAQPASARIPPGQMWPMAARINRAGTELNQSEGLGGIVISTGLPQLLTSVAAKFEVARSLLAISGLELLLITATAMALAARLLASRRTEETALLLARGLTRWQIATLSAAEALGLCLIAAAAGVALGPALAGLQARSLPSAGHRAVSGFAAGVWPGLLVAALAAIVLAWPAADSARAAGISARKYRQPAAGMAIRTGADLAVLVLAVLMAWQLRQYSAIARTASGAPGIDPVLVAAPALILAAGALIPLRLLPALARLADTLAARGSRLVSALTAWEISRRPIRQAGPALLAVLAVATGTLALGQYQSWHESALAQAAASAGADVRIQAPLPDGSAQLAAVVHGRDVTAAMPVSEFNGGLSGQVLALDAREAASVVLLRPDQALVPAAKLWPAIIPAWPAPGLEIPGRAARIALQASVRRVPPGWPLGALPVTLSVQAADGVVYALSAGTIAPDDRSHLCAAAVPPADQASYPLRLIAVSVGYQMPPVPAGRPRAAGPRQLTLGISGLAASAGHDALRPFASGSALRGWRLSAQSAALAGNPQAVGSAPAAAMLPSPAAGSIAVAVSPGDGQLVPKAGLPPLPVSADITFTAGPVLRTIPGIATSSFLAASSQSVGATVVAAVGGYNVDVHIVAAVRSFPATGAGGALIVDQGAIQQVLASQSAAPLAVTGWWLSTRSGLPPGGLPAGTQLTSVRQAETRILSDPLTQAPQQAELAVVVAVALMAILGFAVSVAASRSERRVRAALLAALGVPARSQARQLCLEQALLAGPAAAAGLLIGALAAHLLVPAVTLTASATRPDPAALTYLPLGWAVALAIAITVVPVLAAAVTIAGHPDPATELRSAGTT